MKIKSVILPCEVKARELNSKLLLGCILAERGFEVIVGSRNEIHRRLGAFERSIYLGKDIRYSSVEILKILHALGHVFVAQDEEAQFYYSREKYLSARVHPTVFRAARELLAWGPDNAIAWQNSEFYGGNPVHITGNGRIDLLRPELRMLYSAKAEEYRKSFGRYVLLSSNFSSLNHFFPNLSTVKREDISTLEMKGGGDTELVVHRVRLFREFVALVPQLAEALPDCHIIVRPHPAENHTIWKEASRECRNVTVTNSGDILPWLLGAEALIHNGCTTGLEAYLMDRHAIAFQPFKSEQYDLKLPNDLSFSTGSAPELMRHLKKQLRRKLGPVSLRSPKRDEILARYVKSSVDTLASELIADIIERQSQQPEADSTYASKLYGRIRATARSAIKTWNSKKAGHKSNNLYTLHRFPDTDLSEIQDRINLLSVALGRYASVMAVDLGNNIFNLRRRNS